MYIPSTFSEDDPKILTGLIQQYPLGLLITSGSSGLLASPIPFLYRVKEGKSMLVAHLAKANPHWRDLLELKECLVVFQGAENYVTPAWYPTKQTTHKVVPTWNYEMVQVKGIPTVIESSDWLRSQVGDITDSMEQKRKTPWKVADAPADFIESQLRAIVGLEIEIIEIKGKWKMSQNRPIEDAQGVAIGLSNPNDPHANIKVAEIVSSKNISK
jgi:transcriptional regulator